MLNLTLQVLQNVPKKISGSPREGFSVCDRLKGYRDTWGGPNHLEKRGLRGSGHTYWEMTRTSGITLKHTHAHVHMHLKDSHTFSEKHTLLLSSSLILDQTLRQDAPPQGLVLCGVCNLGGEWQRHETQGFGFVASARTNICCALGAPHWLDELQCWVGFERPTHTYLSIHVSCFLIHYLCNPF